MYIPKTVEWVRSQQLLGSSLWVNQPSSSLDDLLQKYEHNIDNKTTMCFIFLELHLPEFFYIISLCFNKYYMWFIYQKKPPLDYLQTCLNPTFLSCAFRHIFMQLPKKGKTRGRTRLWRLEFKNSDLEVLS